MFNSNTSALCNNSLRENKIYTKGYFEPGKSLHRHLSSPDITFYDILKWMWQIANYANSKDVQCHDVLYSIDTVTVHVTKDGNIVKDTLFRKDHSYSIIDGSIITANSILKAHRTMFENLNLKRLDVLRKRQLVIFNIICNNYFNSFDINKSDNIVESLFIIIDSLSQFIETGVVEDIVDKFSEWD